MTDKDNTVLWRMEGDQFGNVQPKIEIVKLPLRHAGQYADDETGLFYNYFRFYDPATGRYVTSDPIGLGGGLNTYGYVGGSPLRYVDPYGQNAIAIGGAIVIGGALAFCYGTGACQGMSNGLSNAYDTWMESRAKAEDTTDTAFMDNACEPRPNNQDPCKGIRKQLQEHIQKLEDYMNNPLSMDNKGFLSDALNSGVLNRFWKIRATRIQNLKQQIEEFRRKLKICEEKYGKN